MYRLLAVLVVFLLLPLPVAAHEIGTVTLLDGSLRVIRGIAVFQGVEGMRLHSGDIIESADGGFAQLELAGGLIVALGPSTRVYLKEKTNSAELFLLNGWMKAEAGSNVGESRYASPLLGAASRNGTLVLHATPAAAELFAESGTISVGEVTPGGAWGHSSTAKGGQFLTRRTGKNVAVASRPDSTFLESMPRSFRDTLPSRLPHFAGKRAGEPKRDHEVTYSEIQPWLALAPSWRKGFVERFQPRLKDAEFRKAVETHLNEHPEWEAALYPEKHPASQPATVHDPQAPDGRYPR
jgi:hypothetical protein